MSKIDQLTGRGPRFGQSRSHSNIATKRRQDLNLQSVRIGGTRIRVSAHTLKTIKRMSKVLKGEIPTLKQKKVARRIVRATAAKTAKAKV